jgi:hypothetical protein
VEIQNDQIIDTKTNKFKLEKTTNNANERMELENQEVLCLMFYTKKTKKRS